MIALLINCLLLIILDNEHSEHEEHPEVPGGTHQEEVTAWAVRSAGLYRHSEGV